MKLIDKARENLSWLGGKEVAVLISGGVDSSVALALLNEVGAKVKAYYLKIWLEDDLRFLGGDCPWEEDIEFVRDVCEQFGTELEVVPLQKEYFEKVVSYTIDEVKNGRTPNPDVMCNSRIKFGAFWDYIKDAGFDFVASGHYAWRIDSPDGVKLGMAPDKLKDQTYFLSHLSYDQISRLVFPIGCFEKSEVRELAEEFNLVNKNRKDSQGICFLGKLKFRDFVKHYLGVLPGDIIDFDTNEVIGKHEGFYFHTLGQRKGLGLAGGPWYVVKKDVEKNVVYVSRNYFEENKSRNTFSVENLNLIGFDALPNSGLQVKLRHGEKLYNVTSADSAGENLLNVKIDEDDQGIASGQFAVFYKNGICLGSGIMTD